MLSSCFPSGKGHLRLSLKLVAGYRCWSQQPRSGDLVSGCRNTCTCGRGLGSGPKDTRGLSHHLGTPISSLIAPAVCSGISLPVMA